jgi:hypothetical protein
MCVFVVVFGIYALQEVCGMSDLTVVRLLQNPLGQEAPAGHRGDIVRVSDGRASLYLFPWEFEATDEARLRWLLAQKATPANWGDRTEQTEGSHARRP